MASFRFGVSVRDAASRVEWQEKARKVEDLGYSTLLVGDHLAPAFSPLVAIVSAADATRNLRIGSYVLDNDYRHPVLVAREAATVDLLTDGRLELGLGAGHLAGEYQEAGIPFDSGATRVARLAEAVQVIKQLLTGNPVSFEGRHYQLRRHQIYPRPVQRPRPPILLGGTGRRLLSLAAREADLVGLSGLRFRDGQTVADLSAFTATAVDEQLSWLRDAAGSRFEQLELSALVQQVVLTDDRRQAAASLVQQFPSLTETTILETPYLLIGTVDQLVEQLRAQRTRWGISYYVIFEAALEALAPVVARLAGR